MQIIQVSDHVAARISALTQHNGLGVDELLLSVLPNPQTHRPLSPPLTSFDSDLDALVYSPANALPSDFSRRDIYTDHD